MKHAPLGIAAAALALAGSAAIAQETTTTATSAEELLRALEAAGVDISNLATVNEDGTVSVVLPDPPAVGATAAAQAEQQEQEARTLAADGPGADTGPEWDYKLTLGFSFSDGNTENASFAGAFVATLEEEDDYTLTFDSAYFYAKDASETTDNKFTAGVNFDKNLDERWLWFIRGRYDYDQFKSWDHRVSGHTGFGYKWFNTDEFTLITYAGAGAAKEFGSDRNEIIPEGLLGAELEWNITDGQSIKASSTYFPSLLSIDDFRLVNAASYNVEINKADGLSFSVGFLHEHQSIVDPGVDRNDFKVFGGLTFDF